MSMSRHDKTLLVITFFVIAYGILAMQIRARLDLITTKSDAGKELVKQREHQEALIDAEGLWRARYEAVKDKMPVFAPNVQVDTYWLNIMDLAAQQYNVTISSRNAKDETVSGGVSEFAIEVRQWKAPLDALIRFLTALQDEGAMLDIRELRIMPESATPGLLYGSFTLYCAFMRGDAPTASHIRAKATEPPVPETEKTPVPETEKDSAAILQSLLEADDEFADNEDFD